MKILTDNANSPVVDGNMVGSFRIVACQGTAKDFTNLREHSPETRYNVVAYTTIPAEPTIIIVHGVLRPVAEFCMRSVVLSWCAPDNPKDGPWSALVALNEFIEGGYISTDSNARYCLPDMDQAKAILARANEEGLQRLAAAAATDESIELSIDERGLLILLLDAQDGVFSVLPEDHPEIDSVVEKGYITTEKGTGRYTTERGAQQYTKCRLTTAGRERAVRVRQDRLQEDLK